jgi:hypothetical protein
MEVGVEVTGTVLVDPPAEGDAVLLVVLSFPAVV